MMILTSHLFVDSGEYSQDMLEFKFQSLPLWFAVDIG